MNYKFYTIILAIGVTNLKSPANELTAENTKQHEPEQNKIAPKQNTTTISFFFCKKEYRIIIWSNRENQTS